MSQKVKGFLANDGRFFETEPECKRYEMEQAIRSSCESHDVNPDNFMSLLREWNETIRGYYYADDNCKERQATATGSLEFEPVDIPQADEDREDSQVGDKDTPGFLELTLRRSK